MCGAECEKGVRLEPGGRAPSGRAELVERVDSVPWSRVPLSTAYEDVTSPRPKRTSQQLRLAVGGGTSDQHTK